MRKEGKGEEGREVELNGLNEGEMQLKREHEGF